MKKGDKVEIVKESPKSGQVHSISHYIGRVFDVTRVYHETGDVAVETEEMGTIVLNKGEFKLAKDKNEH